MFLKHTLLVAVLCLAVLAPVSAASAEKLLFGLITPTCKDSLLAFATNGATFDSACFNALLSKVLGYAIIAGSCAVKLPQVLKLIAAGSAQGLSPSGMYFETVSLLFNIVYNVRMVSSTL